MEYSSEGRNADDLVSMLGLNETIDQMAIGNIIDWHGNIITDNIKQKEKKHFNEIK